MKISIVMLSCLFFLNLINADERMVISTKKQYIKNTLKKVMHYSHKISGQYLIQVVTENGLFKEKSIFLKNALIQKITPLSKTIYIYTKNRLSIVEERSLGGLFYKKNALIRQKKISYDDKGRIVKIENKDNFRNLNTFDFSIIKYIYIKNTTKIVFFEKNSRKKIFMSKAYKFDIKNRIVYKTHFLNGKQRIAISYEYKTYSGKDVLVQYKRYLSNTQEVINSNNEIIEKKEYIKGRLKSKAILTPKYKKLIFEEYIDSTVSCLLIYIYNKDRLTEERCYRIKKGKIGLVLEYKNVYTYRQIAY